MKLDMHFHSVASDGHSTQEELISLAKQKGLDFIALTDHDVVSYGFKQKAKEQWIISCESVEISANNPEHHKSLHLTFYAQEINQEIGDILSGVVKTKVGLMRKLIEKFNSEGFFLDINSFYAHNTKNGRKIESLNKFDVVVYLFLFEENRKKAYEVNGWVPLNAEEFYVKFLKKWWDAYGKFTVRVKDYEPTLSECKKFVQQCNGILSLAHPNVTFRKWGIEEFERVLPYYIENGGINAVEINAVATKEWVNAILKAKDRYGLYLTFGSDNHQIGLTDTKHGDFWDINSYVNNAAFIKQIFSEYAEKLGV